MRHLREPDQRRRRLRHGVSRRAPSWPNIECFQINPLIKDYNGPACAYVTGPFGGYTANARANASSSATTGAGQMMWEFHQELQGGNGPVFLKLDHLAEETIQRSKTILHTQRAAEPRPLPRRTRHRLPRRSMVEMHISEIGLCSGHSASGVWVNERARDHGDRLVRGGRHGLRAAQLHARRVHLRLARRRTTPRILSPGASSRRWMPAQIERSERGSVRRWIANDGLPPTQVEYKLRRMVNDYLQPPKVTRKMQIGLRALRATSNATSSRCRRATPHELMRAMEVHFIRDCAEMAARASLYRTESRWGLYHYRVDHPQRDDSDWFCHAI